MQPNASAKSQPWAPSTALRPAAPASGDDPIPVAYAGFKRITDSVGERGLLSFDDFEAWVKATIEKYTCPNHWPDVARHKDAKGKLPYFTQCTFRGTRSQANAEKASVLVFDLDSVSEADLDALLSKLRGAVRGFAYASPSDGLKPGRCVRIVLALAGESLPDTAFDLALKGLAYRLEIPNDPATERIEHAFFLGRLEGTEPRQFWHLPGKPVPAMRAAEEGRQLAEQGLIAMRESPKEKIADDAVEDVPDAPAESVARFVAYLREQSGKPWREDSTQPKNARHVHCVKGARLRLSVPQIESAMRGHYLPRHHCETSDHELRTRANNAVRFVLGEVESEQEATKSFLAKVDGGELTATPAPKAGEPFNAPQFYTALNDVVSRARDPILKPALQALAGGTPFPAEHVAELAKKLAQKMRGYRAPEMAEALRASLDVSGVTVEHFASCIQREIDALPNWSEPWAQQLDRDEKGQIKSNISNVLLVLKRHPDWIGRLAYDQLKQDVVYLDQDGRKSTWSEERTTWLRDWIIGTAHFTPSKADVTDAVIAVAKLTTSHPVQVYLNSLVWDGMPRIDWWLTSYCAAEDNEYTRAVGARFLIAAVARAYVPGCKVDTMLIMQGPQGFQKSTAFASLVPEPDWFSDTALNIEDRKDSALQLFGKWIYEIGELHGFSKADTNRVKGFLTSKSDNVRAPYATRNADFPRGCVFAGTTNEETYLTDETGNRRFWPVSVGRCAILELMRDRDQLWAEAVTRYRQGAPWWLDQNQEALAKVEQDSRLVEDAWHSKIKTWLDNLRDGLGVHVGATTTPLDYSKGVTSGEVLEHALGVPVGQHDRAKATRVGAVLRALGGHAVRVGSEARRYRFV
ncbi:MAG: VapE domain-containing protein [Myxococcales bacterium]